MNRLTFICDLIDAIFEIWSECSYTMAELGLEPLWVELQAEHVALTGEER